MRNVWLFVLLILVQHSLFAQDSATYEFRGVWIASIENLDWPKKRGEPIEKIKEEFRQLLDMHRRNGINAVFVQVRPCSDAFYPSPYEPWSEYLFGKQCVIAPDTTFDPLKFMINEAHSRGMEFHAWINPYRAVFNITKANLAPNHVSLQHPDWILTYGNSKYLDPGVPEVRYYVADIVKDIVTRYDVDGVHMDDYFYPYAIPGVEFPDDSTYIRYGNGLKKDVWRRSNSDSIIKLIFNTIANTNGRVKFGVSPFGVWRNSSQDTSGSNTSGGLTCYDNLFADVLLWLRNGWLDYVVPQLYWERSHKLVSFTTLSDWWGKHAYGKHVYIGHGVYKGGTSIVWKNNNELPLQILDVRGDRNIKGSAFFSSKSLEVNTNGWGDSLRLNYYSKPALVPTMAWIDSVPPVIPSVTQQGDTAFLISYNGEKKIRGFGVFNKVNVADSTSNMIDFLPSVKDVVFLKGKYATNDLNKLFVGCVDENNLLSSLVAVKQ